MSSIDLKELKNLLQPDEYEALLRELIEVVKDKLKNNQRVCDLFVKIYERDIKEFRKKFRDTHEKRKA